MLSSKRDKLSARCGKLLVSLIRQHRLLPLLFIAFCKLEEDSVVEDTTRTNDRTKRNQTGMDLEFTSLMADFHGAKSYALHTRRSRQWMCPAVDPAGYSTDLPDKMYSRRLNSGMVVMGTTNCDVLNEKCPS